MGKHIVAWKTIGNENVASSRLRAFLPIRYLKDKKDKRYKVEIFDRKKMDSYSCVIFQKTYDIETVEMAKRLRRMGIKTVFDLCDNHFYCSSNSPEEQKRINLLTEMINTVDLVTVSTPQLGRLIPNKPHIVIDDAIEYYESNFWKDNFWAWKIRNDKTKRIVWFGNAGSESPRFGMIDIQKVLPALKKISKIFSISLTIISNSKSLFDKYIGKTDFPTRYIEWKRTSYFYQLKQHDICVIPADLNPFTEVKTNNRVITALQAGLGVVADRLPSYAEFEKMILFENWEENIVKYIEDESLKQHYVSQAKDYIEQRYGKNHTVKQWESLFDYLHNKE